MFKAVIFDCYGVLLGSGFWNVYEELGGDLTRDAEFVDIQLNRLNSGKMLSVQFAHLMADRLGISLSEWQAAFSNDERPNQPLFDYISQTLKPKVKLGLISNATGASVRSKIPADLLSLFDEVILSGEVGLLKPSPDIFQLALDRLAVKANETVFIDDHQPYVDGATAVGIHGILYKSTTDLKARLASL